MTPVRHKIRALVGEAAIREHSDRAGEAAIWANRDDDDGSGNSSAQDGVSKLANMAMWQSVAKRRHWFPVTSQTSGGFRVLCTFTYCWPT